MTCTHIETTRFSPPTALTQVYKEECTLCFDSQVGKLDYTAMGKDLFAMLDHARQYIGWP